VTVSTRRTDIKPKVTRGRKEGPAAEPKTRRAAVATAKPKAPVLLPPADALPDYEGEHGLLSEDDDALEVILAG
jgi:hypothetical protein